MRHESDFPPSITDLSVSCADYVPGYWDIAPRPRAKRPSRLFLIFAFLVSLAPAPVLPALFIIPFAAGLFVFVWLVLTSGWQFR